VTGIELERIVPLDTPDAETCVDGVCEIPGALTEPAAETAVGAGAAATVRNDRRS
jgi:hypothetical protein